jgi:hypothetical protein
MGDGRRLPPHPCAYPGCGRSIDGPASRCERHAGSSARSARAAYRSATWQRVRVQALARAGGRCEVPGCERTDVDVDHRTSWQDGGADTLANAWVLCKLHHGRKTLQDQELYRDPRASTRRHMGKARAAAWLAYMNWAPSDGTPQPPRPPD